MNAIYLMLIILAIAWFIITYEITVEGIELDSASKVFYCVAVTVCVAALSFLVIIFGPSKIV